MKLNNKKMGRLIPLRLLFEQIENILRGAARRNQPSKVNIIVAVPGKFIM